MAVLAIADIRACVAEIAEFFGVKKVSLFGSYALGRETEKSDVDLLVEFNEDSVSLFKLSDMRYELENLMSRKVDLIHAPIPEDSFLEIEKEILLYDKAS